MATTGSPQGPDGPILTLVIMTMVVRTFFRETFPEAPPSVDQLGYWLHTQGAVFTFSLPLPVKSSQVNRPQALRENCCACSWSLSSINDEKMISCARFYWNCLFNSWISHPGLSFISFQMKFNYPVPSQFQFSGRDGSGTWKKVWDGSGTGILSDPANRSLICLFTNEKRWCKG